ncbi:DUF3995 domain-containing protein [Streptomyces malaysiensis]|uniref:DUF3995 domain-containing protein n=1 Tax=Streptomyces malaysiensis TaxID=92644 RepID=A0A2J7YQ51_STRMQ|nr:DUF3995 domain-containing protein [Streptomyces malaysiensis]PNG90134.1 hypothetical protein SMF913_25599 [Streptomyces malaysiensis]
MNAPTARDPGGRQPAWAGYTAAVLAVVFGLFSFYWAAGGTFGLDTLGAAIQRMAERRDSGFIAVVWITGALKVAGGLFSLSLVRPWGRVVPRPLMLLAGWGGAALLTVYGALQVGSLSLVASGVLTPSDPVEWKPLLWRLFVWDMSFLVWGILLFLATRTYVMNHPRRPERRGGN